jgi:hypothetical protein
MTILLSAITKTIKVIANSTMAAVRLEYFLESLHQSYVYCLAKVHERKYGRARKLLNASIKDKTFDRNVSDALGVSVNMSYTYYTRGADSSEEENPVKIIAIST